MAPIAKGRICNTFLLVGVVAVVAFLKGALLPQCQILCPIKMGRSAKEERRTAALRRGLRSSPSCPAAAKSAVLLLLLCTEELDSRRRVKKCLARGRGALAWPILAKQGRQAGWLERHLLGKKGGGPPPPPVWLGWSSPELYGDDSQVWKTIRISVVSGGPVTLLGLEEEGAALAPPFHTTCLSVLLEMMILSSPV